MNPKKPQKTDKVRNSKVIRINRICIKKFEEMGNGNVQKGIEKSLRICDTVKKNPEEICMQHISDFMIDVHQFYGDNHSEHFDNFPAFVVRGLRKGHFTKDDFTKLNARPEQTIDKFGDE